MMRGFFFQDNSNSYIFEHAFHDSCTKQYFTHYAFVGSIMKQAMARRPVCSLRKHPIHNMGDHCDHWDELVTCKEFEGYREETKKDRDVIALDVAV